MKLNHKYRKVDERSHEEYILAKIEKDENATWVTVQDSKEKTLTFGKKAFKAKFQLKEN